MMKTPTRQEQATNYELWTEYVDASGIYTKKKFYSMTVEEKVRIIESIFGPEKPKEDAAE